MVPQDGYLRKAQELLHKHKALLIADEVQTGLCRWVGCGWGHRGCMVAVVLVVWVLGWVRGTAGWGMWVWVRVGGGVGGPSGTLSARGLPSLLRLPQHRSTTRPCKLTHPSPKRSAPTSPSCQTSQDRQDAVQ